MRECGRAFEFGAGLIEPAELLKQVATHARQQMIGLQRGLSHQRIDDFEPGLRTEQHCERHCAIEVDDRRRGNLGKRPIKSDDTCPVRFLSPWRTRVTGRDGRLQRVRTWHALGRAGQRFGACERGETAADEQVIPARAVLIEQ